ncbi:hypothetical protein Vi05172_g13392 [Venturia inaequalis]|nr:hypothetical protein Vi05172_g13392 [Venturia inaequalis]
MRYSFRPCLSHPAESQALPCPILRDEPHVTAGLVTHGMAGAESDTRRPGNAGYLVQPQTQSPSGKGPTVEQSAARAGVTVRRETVMWPYRWVGGRGEERESESAIIIHMDRIFTET